MAEERFELRGGKRLKARTFVVVTDDAIEVHSPYLKNPIVLDRDGVAHVVRLSSSEPLVEVYAGAPRRLDVAPPVKPSTVVLVLPAALRVDDFKMGVDKALPITPKERRSGIDVQVIGIAVDDPDALAASIAACGAQPGESLADAMRSQFGLATPDEAAAARDKARRGLILAWAAVALFQSGLLIVAVGAGDLFDPDTPDQWSRLAEAFAGAAAGGLAGWQVVLRWPGRLSGEIDPAVTGRGQVALMVGFITWGIGFLGLTAWQSTPPVLFGIWLAAPVGGFAGYLQRFSRATILAGGDESGGGPVDHPV